MYLARQRLIKKQIQINRNRVKNLEYNKKLQQQQESNSIKQRSSRNQKLSKPQQSNLISPQSLYRLQLLAHEQLSMQKVTSRQIDYHRIQLFLLFSNQERKVQFYKRVNQSLRQIFSNQKAKKVFDQRWTPTLKSNVMGLFYRVVQDYYYSESANTIKQFFNQLYYETIEKLMKDEKISRIQQKFLDSFLSQTMRQPGMTLDILGSQFKNQIYRHTSGLQKILNSKQTPKSLSNSQYLQYSVFSLLGFTLPHQKYLYNQLLHAPNPKYLFPFKKKGTFISLTNQILVKSNKIDMIGFKYWSYYEYQQSDIYQKVRKASEWEQKIIPLAIMLKKKVIKGLQRYLNLIDEKVRNHNARSFEEDGINLLNSYVQLCLEICYNHIEYGNRNSYILNPITNQPFFNAQFNNLSRIDENYIDFRDQSAYLQNSLHQSRRAQNFIQSIPKASNKQLFFSNDKITEDLSTILERVDIGTALQSQILTSYKESKLKYFTLKLTELYFILLISCKKTHLRIKFIINFSSSIQKIIVNQNDKKFTQEVTIISLKYLGMLTYEERYVFIYSILERLNQQWENQQSVKINNEISKIDGEVLEYLSFIIQKFGLDDGNDPTKKVLKLEFFYILALNFNQNSYFQSKKRLAKCQLTINVNLSNNPILDTLQIRKVTQEKFKAHLRQLFGDYSLAKKEHEGILAIIDEILTYRIQVSKDLPSNYGGAFGPDENRDVSVQDSNSSFYAVLINFLQESERLDPTKNLLNTVKNYCEKCKKTYFIEINQMKFKDETKKRARKLITQDVSFLVQASISSNPIIAQFSQSILFEYIEQISQLAFYTRILIVFAECITILYRKASIQYQSKAQILKGRNLSSSILIPTDNKVIIKRLIKIMIALYKIILKGHCIDDNYMKVKIGYLIKQYSKSAKTPFGWKYLKYLLNNFKQDKQFIAKQILTNNSCSWFINEKYFAKKIKEMKPEKLLLDRYLLPLHNGDCTPVQLKKLLTNIDLQEETQFLIVPAKGTEQESFREIIEDIQKSCKIIQKLQLSISNNTFVKTLNPNSSMQNLFLKKSQLFGQAYSNPNNNKNSQNPNNNNIDPSSQLQQYQNKLYDIISRIKMMYINKLTQIQIFSSIFDICKKYNNAELLKYILIKIIPFVYCINQFNQRMLVLVSQMLFYVVNQLNKATKFVYQQFNNSGNGGKPNQAPDQNQNANQNHNTFDLLLNCFEGIDQYQVRQHSKSYQNLYAESISHNANNLSKSLEEKSYKFMIIKFYSLRIFNLKKMFKELQKFLNESMHVCIGKGFSLSLIVQIFSINFILDQQVIQFLHLQSICYCLTSQLELVNVLKSSLQKGQTSFEQRTMVEDFEQQTLKLGLNHFQRRHNYYRQELLNQTHNIKSLKTKIDFLVQICDYLRNQDFHQLRKKKLPKRTDKIFAKHRKAPNLFNQITNEGQKKSFLFKNHFQRTSLASEHGQSFQIRKNIRQSDSNSQSDFYDPGALRFTLLYLISEQIDKTKAYSFSQLCQIQNPYSLAQKKKFISSQMILSTYNQMGESDILIFNMLKIFGNRIDKPEEIEVKLSNKISQNPDHGFSEFLQIFIESNKKNPDKIKQINFWKPPNIQILFKYLSKDYEQYPYLQQYVTKILSRLHSQQILFYLPQIFQTLTLKTGKIIYNFLLQYARHSASFAHQLIWIAKVQSKQQQDPHNKNPRLPGVNQNLRKLQKISKKLIKDILRQFTKQQKIFFREVNDFYQEVTAISGKMKPSELKQVKKDIIRAQVQKIIIPESAYLPINPIYKVVDIDKQSGIPMQSAAKCPFLLTFRCRKYQGPDKDFENRKKYKKLLQYSQLQNEFEQIKEEQQPHRLPIFNTVTHGGRSPHSQIKIHSQQNLSIHGQSKGRVKFSTPSRYVKHEQISINDIRMDFSENSSKKDITSIGTKGKQNAHYKPKLNISKLFTQNQGQSNQLVQISCIYKVFDDIRQDCLALQVIRLFTQIFERHNLQLKLFSYKTISNRTGQELDIGGIIEVVPKTVSRDSIGKTNQQSLYEFFISNFGPQYNIRFQQARQNFIRSQAAYSIVSYILQIKDRHNGNILINTEEGYLVHIDFGFIFDISPANNLRFEKADFKLTEEMIKIMGGSLESQPFQLYLNLVIKGFLISRRYSEHIINIIKQMYHSGLPCFLPKSLQNLRNRFVLQMSQIQAAQYMKQIVYKAADNFFTNWYDKIQWIQQKIYH